MGAAFNRIAKLQADHRAADEKITEIQKRPNPDMLELKKLKLDKLRFKEELKRLNAQAA